MNFRYKESLEVKMTNILFTIILVLGMKVADVTLSPKHYLITYQDGQREMVVVTKSNDICPTYCGIDHAHKVDICEGGDCDPIERNFVISKQKTGDNTFNLYCKGKEIMLFQKVDGTNDTKSKKKTNSIEIF